MTDFKNTKMYFNIGVECYELCESANGRCDDESGESCSMCAFGNCKGKCPREMGDVDCTGGYLVKRV